jgi:RND family efflux transporter MFP subunit
VLHQTPDGQAKSHFPRIRTAPKLTTLTKVIGSGLVTMTLLLGLNACSKPTPIAKQEAPRPVRVIAVGEATMPAASLSMLSLPGEIRPRIESRLGFRVGGKLIQRLLNVGQSVKAGQVIARLDPQDAAPGLASAQAQLEGARTDLKIAQIELKRVADLVEKNFVSKAQLDRQQATADAATARVHAAEASLKQARNSVDFQTLVADVDGIVTAVEAEVGQVLTAGTPVYRVARRNEKELLINVPETEFAAARNVSQWRVTLPALGRELQGKLREITPLADAASRSYAMRITLLGNLEGVEMGMTANAQAQRGSGSGDNDRAESGSNSMPAIGKLVALPLGAIFSKDGQPGVWVVDASGAVSLIRVVIASMNEELVFVTAGLSPGQKVVTAGANLLKPGQVVRIEASSK